MLVPHVVSEGFGLAITTFPMNLCDFALATLAKQHLKLRLLKAVLRPVLSDGIKSS